MRPWNHYEFIRVPMRIPGRYPPVLEAGDVSRPAAERLASLIVETWCRIDSGSRRVLTKHWRRDGWCHAKFGVVPVLYRINGYQEEVTDAPRIEALGLCNSGGDYFRFAAPFVEHAPDAAVRTLIAHELAHGLLHARGLDYSGDIDVEHYDVERLLLGWGYVERVIDDACAALPAAVRTTLFPSRRMAVLVRATG